jgi:hypothetical protein
MRLNELRPLYTGLSKPGTGDRTRETSQSWSPAKLEMVSKIMTRELKVIHL